MPINNNRKAELWAYWAGQAMAGIEAGEHTHESVTTLQYMAGEAAQMADHMLAEFFKRYPEYTGD